MPLTILSQVTEIVAPGGRQGGRPERPEHDKKDCSKSKSWSKSRGHKSHGKGRKHGKKDC
jgi:hypothetical protein